MRERPGCSRRNARIGVVRNLAAACEVSRDGASKSEQQKCGINVPASPQRTADYAGPAPRARLAVGQRGRQALSVSIFGSVPVGC